MSMSLEIDAHTESSTTDPCPPSPASHPPTSAPPPIPESVRRLSERRAAVHAPFIDVMFERLAAGDYAGVLFAAEALLVHLPNHPDALDCAQIARSELRKVYVARIGSLQAVPRICVSPEGLQAMGLDYGAGVLLSRIDGETPVMQLVESSGLPPLDALRIVSELFLRRAIGF
jgi:hypothetical protein